MQAYKDVAFGDDARQKLKAGIDRLTDVVKTTLGPKGMPVILDRPYGPPKVVNDGVTIAEEQHYLDKFENMGAQLVKQVSKETEDVAGDGTTTATILAHAIITEGMKHIVAGANPVQLKRGLDRVSEALVAELSSKAVPLNGKEGMIRVATISSNDEEIGRIIADTMEAAGEDGVITVEESDSMDTYFETVEGMEFDRGYVHPYMRTSDSTQEAVLVNPLVFITTLPIKTAQEAAGILNVAHQQGRPVLIIADEVVGEALNTVILNKMKGTVLGVVVKAPGFGDRKKLLLDDIAILTGGTVVSKEIGLALDAVTKNVRVLGSASKIIVTKDSTTIIRGAGEGPAIEGRISEIKAQAEVSESDFEREKLQERAAKLAGGVAVIKVGAATESELEEKKHRLEDALEATKAAIEGGILPGGGVALLNSLAALDALELPVEQEVAKNILRVAVEAPIFQLAVNAGLKGAIIVERVKELPAGRGFDVSTERYVDMVQSGIIDPAKVTKSALLNAISVAGMILTSGAAVVTKLFDDGIPTPPQPQGGMY